MGVKFPKPETYRSEKYLSFVRNLPCCICDRPGPNEAHHAGQVRGVAIKADDLTVVSLCSTHHREFHDKGRITFEEKHHVNLWEVIARTITGYVKEKGI